MPSAILTQLCGLTGFGAYVAPSHWRVDLQTKELETGLDRIFKELTLKHSRHPTEEELEQALQEYSQLLLKDAAQLVTVNNACWECG